jgi:two-component system nitrogen regulation sensor histidine kinase NtrY
MRMRFAVSGHAPKVEVKEQTVETKEQAIKEPALETAGRDETTNNEVKIKAATGN